MQKIIIADNHPIFRSGIKGIIQSMEDVTPIAEAENGI
jgi:DNA-binding NarL/FixJ family response regulator